MMSVKLYLDPVEGPATEFDVQIIVNSKFSRRFRQQARTIGI